MKKEPLYHSITIRIAQKDKELLHKIAKEKGQTLTTYLLENTLAKIKQVQMFQEPTNEIESPFNGLDILQVLAFMPSLSFKQKAHIANLLGYKNKHGKSFTWQTIRNLLIGEKNE